MNYYYKGLPNFLHQDIPDIQHPNILLKRVFPINDINKKEIFKKIKNLDLSSSISEINTKLNMIINNLKENEYNIIQINTETLTNLIVGFGSSSTLETSICLDGVLGIPFIPGSSLKGCHRDYVTNYKNDFFDNNEFKLVFGSSKNNNNDNEDDDNISGNVTYLNAYPYDIDKPFDIDVMTVHFEKYYKSEKYWWVQSQYDNPLPINFLCIKKGVKFKFNLIISSKINNLQQKIDNSFKEMLQSHGVGAKTNVNYGYFKIL